MIKKKLAAFSVLEAAVSMVISAIIIGLVFVIFTILSERMLDFKNQNLYIADLNRMAYSFNKDIFESDSMQLTESGIVFSSYSGAEVKYNIYPDYFLRTKNEFIDTFAIPVKSFRLDTLQGKNRKIVFQRLHLGLKVNISAMQLRFFKRIYADQLLKKDLIDDGI